jgi:2,3-bisphosphoglycerate-independent phosphoglycerate mutase
MYQAFLRLAVVILTAFATTGCPQQVSESPARRPNVLFVLLDGLRRDALGHAGHPHVKTPQIERLDAWIKKELPDQKLR